MLFVAFPRAGLWLSHSFGCFVAGLGRTLWVWQALPCEGACAGALIPLHDHPTSPRSSDFSGISLYNKNANAFSCWAQSSQFFSNQENKNCSTTWTLVAVLTAKVFPGSLSNFSSLFPRTAVSNLNCKWQAGDCCAALPELMLCFHVFSFINSSSASLC